MGRGGLEKADAQRLLYGPRRSGSGPLTFGSATPKTIREAMAFDNKIPDWLLQEFPEAEIKASMRSTSSSADGQRAIRPLGEVTLTGVDPEQDLTLGMVVDGPEMFYYLGPGLTSDQERGRTIFGSEAEKHFLSCLASNSKPGLDIEFTVYNRRQLDSFLDNYSNQGPLLTNSDYSTSTVEDGAMSFLENRSQGLSDIEQTALAQSKTLIDLINNPHGRDILANYLNDYPTLQFFVKLSNFRR